MDSVRFGRALGIGTRLAAKTLVTAVDAATSPNPSRPPTRNPSPPPAPPGRQPAAPAASTARAAAGKPTRQLQSTTRGLAEGSRRFGQAVWRPTVKLSGVLWLELTGVFFGIFALSATIAAWKLRANLHRTPANADAHTHLLFAIGIAIVFAYFCASSFLRARRRGRQP